MSKPGSIRRGNDPSNVRLEDSVAAWPTPNATDGEKAPKRFAGGNLSLPETARHWSTPRASDGEKGGPNQAFGAGGIPLPAQTAQWRTPQAMDAERGSNGTWVPKPKAGEHSLRHQIEKFPVSFHQVHPTYPVGQVSSHPRRSLNPLFVEWLMGWPPGWTLLAWTDFGCSETALSAWKQRMRSALSSLGSPPEAPPAQISLFG